MDLEDSTGKIQENVSLENVISCIDRLGKDLDHCILGEGDEFIQSASGGGGFLVEYGDAGGHYTAEDDNLSADQVKELFSAFYNHDPSWKTKISFTRQGDGEASAATAGSSPAAAGSGDSGSGQGVTNFEQKSLKDTVMDSVKREAQNSFSYMLRRVVRRFFRRFF